MVDFGQIADTISRALPNPVKYVPLVDFPFVDLPGWAVPWVFGLMPYLALFLFAVYRMFWPTDRPKVGEA